MQAGRLRHPVTLQKLVRTQDPVTGAMRDEWVSQGTTWASIEGVSGREFFAAQAVQAETTYRITMRHRAIDPTWRLMADGVAYGIEAVLPDNRRSQMVLMCKTL